VEVAAVACYALQWVVCDDARDAASEVIDCVAKAVADTRSAGSWQERFAAEYGEQACLVRDIFPYHPPVVDDRWRTSDVMGLVRAIEEQRAFDRMPILGDALEDAGCPEAAFLKHCRGPWAHSRGCWVMDLLLGRE
jgi:hypothetical protein